MIDFQQGDISFKADSFADLASLFKKIAAVTGGLRSIPKTHKHQQGWMYAGWEEINSALGEELGKHNLAVITSQNKEPSFEVVGKNSNGTPNLRAFISVTYVLGDGETGASASGSWYGHADDTSGGEKSIDKAATYAVKSMVKKLFLVSSGEEDPEGNDQQVSGDYQPQKQKKQAPPKQQAPAQEQQPAPQQQAPKGESKAPPANLTIDAFLAGIKEIGFDRDEAKDILFRYGFPKNDKGGLSWNPQVHQSMLNALDAFTGFYFKMKMVVPAGQEVTFDDAEKEIVYLTGAKPLTEVATRNAESLVKPHIDFNIWAQALTSEAQKLLEGGKLLPWTSAQDGIMRAFLTGKVAGTKAEVEEDGKIEDVVNAADTDGIVMTVTPLVDGADPDLFGDMFDESSTTL